MYREDELYHHGVKGMKWGVRKYQNVDGSLTPAGEKRYGGSEVGRAKLAVKVAKKDYNKSYNEAYKYSRNHPVGQWTSKKKSAEADRRWNDAAKKADALSKAKSDYKQAKKAAKENSQTAEQTGEKKGLSDKQKKAIKVGAAIAGTALAAYGTYKLNKYVKTKAYNVSLERGRKVVNDHLDKLDRKTLYDIDLMFPTLEERTSSKGIKYANSAFKVNDRIADDLYDKTFTYAKQKSKNAVSAIKTLRDKNDDLSIYDIKRVRKK